jgi:hypothetical protein
LRFKYFSENHVEACHGYFTGRKKDQEEVQALFFFSTTYLFHIRHRISNLFNLHQLHLGRGCPQARLDVSIPLLFFFRRTLQTEVSAKISTLHPASAPRQQ